METEVQMYEGNGVVCLLPNQVETFGRSLIGFAKGIGMLSGKIRNLDFRQSLLRYSGHMLTAGMKCRVGRWDEEDMNSVPLYLSQITCGCVKFGFPKEAHEAQALFAEFEKIQEAKRS
jgi:hypothetical protein